MTGMNQNGSVGDTSIPFFLTDKSDASNACCNGVGKLSYRSVHSIFIVSRWPNYVKLHVFVDPSNQFEGFDEVKERHGVVLAIERGLLGLEGSDPGGARNSRPPQ